jgi:hypothetical protein
MDTDKSKARRAKCKAGSAERRGLTMKNTNHTNKKTKAEIGKVESKNREIIR